MASDVKSATSWCISRCIARTHAIKQEDMDSLLIRVKTRRYTRCFGMPLSRGSNVFSHPSVAFS
jgi:hypothetical protein